MTIAKLTDEPRPHEAVPAGALEDLPELVAHLGNDLVRLLDGKLGLLKIDLEEQARGYVRELLVTVTAAIVAAGGLLLVAVGLSFTLAYLLPSSLDPLLLRALAFAVVGSVIALGGWLVLRRGGAFANKAEAAAGTGDSTVGRHG